MAELESDLRRRLLKVVGAFFLGVPAAEGLAAAKPSALERRTLAVFLDILLPRDDLSGSASDLGVDAKLWAFAMLDSRFRRLVGLGCRWLDMTGRGGFADLPPAEQVAVVAWMSESDWNQVPRRFYELVRQAAIETYYSDPAALAGLPLQPSPQPLGYPPPWR